METLNQTNTTHRETFSPMLLAFLKQKIKELGQEKNEQIIMESIQVVADEITHKQVINTKEIKDELEERLKGELATRDFVRAEINQVRTELAEVRQELKQDIAEVRQELAEVKQELKQENADLKADIRFIRQEMKFYAIGLGVLMIILQPKVFEFISTLFK